MDRERLRSILRMRSGLDSNKHGDHEASSEFEQKRMLFGRIRALKPFRGDNKKFMAALDTQMCPELLAFAKSVRLVCLCQGI